MSQDFVAERNEEYRQKKSRTERFSDKTLCATLNDKNERNFRSLYLSTSLSYNLKPIEKLLVSENTYYIIKIL